MVTRYCSQWPDSAWARAVPSILQVLVELVERFAQKRRLSPTYCMGVLIRADAGRQLTHAWLFARAAASNRSRAEASAISSVTSDTVSNAPSTLPVRRIVCSSWHRRPRS